jgi:hypothetical protein
VQRAGRKRAAAIAGIRARQGVELARSNFMTAMRQESLRCMGRPIFHFNKEAPRMS